MSNEPVRTVETHNNVINEMIEYHTQLRVVEEQLARGSYKKRLAAVYLTRAEVHSEMVEFWSRVKLIWIKGTTAMDAHKLMGVIQRAGYAIREDYSGRGMFGRCCVGLTTVDSVATVLANLSDQCVDKSDSEYIIRQHKIDSMGRGIVMYWPHVEKST